MVVGGRVRGRNDGRNQGKKEAWEGIMGKSRGRNDGRGVVKTTEREIAQILFFLWGGGGPINSPAPEDITATAQ